MKMLVVVEELPCAGRNGYSTYNRAFLDCFLAAGHELHVCVTGPRLDGLAFRPARLLGSDRPVFHFLHARKAGPAWFASTGAALARGANAWLPGFLRRAGAQAGGRTVVIGRRLAPRESASVAALVDRIGPDWVFVDTIFRAGFIPLLRSSPRLGLIAHDVFWQRCRSIADQGFTVSPWVDAGAERAALGAFDRIVAISGEDASALAELAPERPVTTLMSPLDVVVAGGGPPGAGRRMLYVGSRAHHNVQGIRWFLDEVWPRVLAAVPGAALDVAGSVCDGLRAGPGVTLHGRVDSIAALAQRARFAINPVLAGSGLKIKMLDYFAHGLPCITTSLGATGFPRSSPSPIRVADDAESCAASVADWLQSDGPLGEARAALPGYVTFFARAGFDARLGALLREAGAAHD
jgi:hypothetical protein